MKILAKNKKALFNFEPVATYTAGIVLEGWEVKSVKTGRISLKESFITMRKGEAFLTGAHIAKWPGMSDAQLKSETRDRKLLLNASELKQLARGVKERGSTIVPLDMHLQRNNVKLSLALARGKKLHDKRAKIKETEQKRSIARDIKYYNLK